MPRGLAGMRRLLLFALLALQTATAAEGAGEQNFLIILLDDVGLDNIAIYEERLDQQLDGYGKENPPKSTAEHTPPLTPFLDRLAVSRILDEDSGEIVHSLLFNNVWAMPVCSPTRATTLSGRYPFRTGMGYVDPSNNKPHKFTDWPGLDLGSPNLARTLKESGYATAAFGKWHIGGCITDEHGACLPEQEGEEGEEPLNLDVTHPVRLGFDHFAGTVGNITASKSSFPNLLDAMTYCDWVKITADANDDGPITWSAAISNRYATYDTTQDAKEWISLQEEEEQEGPWFAWVAFHASHKVLHNTNAITSVRVAPEKRVSDDVHVEDCEAHFSTKDPDPPLDPRPKTARKSFFDDMTRYMDEQVGSLLAGVPRNTTIIVFGDNGTGTQAIERPFFKYQGKSSLFQGGVNVPFIVNSPEVIPPPAPSKPETDALVSVADIFATVVDIAGIESCIGQAGCADDSISFRHILNDNATPPNPPSGPPRTTREYVYAEIFAPVGPIGLTVTRTNSRAIRNDRYKLILSEGVDRTHPVGTIGLRPQLFDLQADPFEWYDLLTRPEGLNADEEAQLRKLRTAMADLMGSEFEYAGKPIGDYLIGGADCPHGDLDGDKHCDRKNDRSLKGLEKADKCPFKYNSELSSCDDDFGRMGESSPLLGAATHSSWLGSPPK